MYERVVQNGPSKNVGPFTPFLVLLQVLRLCDENALNAVDNPFGSDRKSALCIYAATRSRQANFRQCYEHLTRDIFVKFEHLWFRFWIMYRVQCKKVLTC